MNISISRRPHVPPLQLGKVFRIQVVCTTIILNVKQSEWILLVDCRYTLLLCPLSLLLLLFPLFICARSFFRWQLLFLYCRDSSRLWISTSFRLLLIFLIIVLLVFIIVLLLFLLLFRGGILQIRQLLPLIEHKLLSLALFWCWWWR